MGQSRRSFLKTTTALAVGAAVVPRVLQPSGNAAEHRVCIMIRHDGWHDRPGGRRQRSVQAADDDGDLGLLADLVIGALPDDLAQGVLDLVVIRQGLGIGAS